MERQAQAIFESWFTGKREINGCLADICQYSKEKVAVSSLDLESYYSTENMLPGKAGATQAANLPTTTQTTKCNVGDVLISNIRPYFRKIVYCHADCGCSTDVLCFAPKKQELSAHLFFLDILSGYINPTEISLIKEQIRNIACQSELTYAVRALNIERGLLNLAQNILRYYQ